MTDLRPRLACTVRGCVLPLVRDDRRYACAAGHSYDIARSGYVNLLQPQDRRSLEAGDTREAVEARRRLLDAGAGRTLIESVVTHVAGLDLPDDAQVVDLGCGTGDALAAIAGVRLIAAVGVDLSATAIEHAARRHPDLTWVVANADRRLPFPDASTQLVLSINARRNAEEVRRVLTDHGFMIAAVPAPTDLQELRASVHGEATERDRVDALVAVHEGHFRVVERWMASETVQLAPERLQDLLQVSYRGRRQAVAPRVAALATMAVTIASDLVLFAPK